MKRFLLFGVLMGLLIFVFRGPPAGARTVDWRAKVDPQVLEDVETGASEFILFLEEQADLSRAEQLATKAEKGRYVYDQLTAVANRTQGPLLERLRAISKSNNGQVEFRPFWVTNAIWVRGDRQTLEIMAQQPEVAAVYGNPQIQADLPELLPEPPDAPAITDDVWLWGLTQVGAPEVWAMGVTGEGVVIGGQDTGYAWEHPALKGKYRGWNGTAANHNYNWHDAIHSGVASCPPDSPAPCDDQYHGTHTMGTMVGDNGLGKQIGMAPGARWIGCRNMREGFGTPDTYIECYQWFIAPTDLNDANPRPDLAPDVINNSWSCPQSEGCTDPNVMLAVVNAVRAAGIVTVHSAGNGGSSCSTVRDPAAIYDASFSVGNTDQNDNISPSSSRGPVMVDGSGRMKPDVSAPGESIYSSIPPGSYGFLSGTSMAGPHVVGLVALMISANPALRGHVDQIEDLIRFNALPRTIDQICGGVPGSQVPNNTYGWGRIDALKTVDISMHFIDLRKTASTLFYDPGDHITYTLWFTNTHQLSPASNVILTDTLPAGVNFISATPPFSLNGRLVTWSFPSLDPQEIGSVQLVVGVPQNPSSTVANLAYGVRSAEFSIPFPPLPVISYLAVTWMHIPVVFR